MSYSTMMVQASLTASGDTRLAIAAGLARRFDARLIGVAAVEPLEQIYVGTTVSAAVRLADEEEAESLLSDAEAHFRSALKGSGCPLEWRQAVAEPTRFLERAARAADVVVIGAPRRQESRGNPIFDADGFVVRAGRPVIVVPPEADALRCERVLIAWKDMPEARRAIADAVPLLRRADEVIVAGIDEGHEPAPIHDGLDDVVRWLGRHQVRARANYRLGAEGSPAIQLDTCAWEHGADLIVAGAYGHSRLREWALGGVTRDLLHATSRCSFLSH